CASSLAATRSIVVDGITSTRRRGPNTAMPNARPVACPSGEQIIINDDYENVCELKAHDKKKAVIKHLHGECLLKESLGSRNLTVDHQAISPALYAQPRQVGFP